VQLLDSLIFLLHIFDKVQISTYSEKATKFQRMTCDVRSQVASCDVRSQVALCECEPMRVVFFRCAKCNRNFAHFCITKDTNFISNSNDGFSGDSFYLYFVSVRQKLEI
jgi:hypothetical protein